MEIRQASISDAEEIDRLLVSIWKTSYRGVISDNFLDSFSVDIEKRKQTFLDLDLKTDHYVATSDSKILGYIKGHGCESEDLSRTYEIGACYVAADLQGKGIGKELFQTLCSGLDKKLWDQIIVWTLKEAAQSISFYESLGFEKDGEEKEMYFGDKVSLVKLRKAV